MRPLSLPGLAAICTAALAAVGTPSPAVARPAPPPAVAQLPAPSHGTVRQLLTVTAPSRRSTRASFAGYWWSEARQRWVRVFGPWTARVGYNGIAPPGRKREGDGRTPSGTYGFGFFFGVRPDPGFAFGYRRAYRYDVWDDDPSSPLYNEWVDERTANPGRDPEPLHQVPAYDYAAVIAYNTARVPGRGSAIFLHVTTHTATAGCVSLPMARLLRVLRWLRRRFRPQITIAVR